MKRWQEHAKVFVQINGQPIAAQVTSTSIRDGKQYCRLKVAVMNQLTGKTLVADQVRMVRGDSLKARHTIIAELGEKQEI